MTGRSVQHIRSPTVTKPHTKIRIWYSLKELDDMVNVHTFDMVIDEWARQIPEEIVEPDQSFWINSPLKIGDEIYFTAPASGDIKQRSGPNADIGAFWQVKHDGSLEYTGT